MGGHRRIIPYFRFQDSYRKFEGVPEGPMERLRGGVSRRGRCDRNVDRGIWNPGNVNDKRQTLPERRRSGERNKGDKFRVDFSVEGRNRFNHLGEGVRRR